MAIFIVEAVELSGPEAPDPRTLTGRVLTKTFERTTLPRKDDYVELYEEQYLVGKVAHPLGENERLPKVEIDVGEFDFNKHFVPDKSWTFLAT